MEGVFSLVEAEELTGKPASSLRRMLNAGEIGGFQIAKGQRKVWVIPQATIDLLSSKNDVGDYKALLEKWKAEQASGFHGDKPIGTRGIVANLGGMQYFWRYLKQEPTIKAITAENLKLAISNVPLEHETQNCHFVQKEHMYKAVCSFTKLLIREGLRSEMDLHALQKIRFKRVYEAKRTSISEDQLKTLIQQNKEWNSGGRDNFDRQLTHMLIVVSAYTGLRRAEVMNLKIEDINQAEGIIQVLDGKGHKNRVVGILPELDQALTTWLKFHRPPSDSQMLLIQENGNPVTTTVIGNRIRRISEHTGIKINPHGLRRTFATLMENRGMPWSMIQMALGHSDQRTTQSYIRSDEKDMIKWMCQGNIRQPEFVSTKKADSPEPKASRLIVRRLLGI